MYAVTSMPLERRTRATFRRAEFGFLGVMIFTCRHTPFFWGQPCSAGCLGRRYCGTRGFRTSWLIVGIAESSLSTPARPVGRDLSPCPGRRAAGGARPGVLPAHPDE